MSLHTSNALTATAERLGYIPVVERIYKSDHPDVVAWTSWFGDRFREKRIFERFERKMEDAVKKDRAVVVGTQWYRFSSFMPWFLCRAASTMSTNNQRHYVIQTAFEELGMRDEAEIHPQMFWEAASVAGVSAKDRERLAADRGVTAALDKLRSMLLSYRSDARVLGILLGLEMPAVENIETAFSSLAHDASVKKPLEETKFFQLHRCIEIEHVRLTLSNFLRFCPEKAQKDAFIAGFDDGIAFWSQFWKAISRTALSESARRRNDRTR